MGTNLNAADGFNVFVLGNHTESNADAEGRVAVGGDAVYTNYGVGDRLTMSDDRHDLIVRGNVNIIDGVNSKGNTVIYPESEIVHFTMGHGNGVSDQPLVDTPIDFDAASAYLKSASAYWGSIPANGTAAVEYGGLILTGNNTDLNVFSIDGENVEESGLSFEQLNSIHINAPLDSTILINVSGNTVGFGNLQIFCNGETATGSNGETILWNLPDATVIPANTTSIKGSLLAPNATYNSEYSNVEGAIIVENLYGHVEAHNYLFKGSLPILPSDGKESDNQVELPVANEETEAENASSAEDEETETESEEDESAEDEETESEDDESAEDEETESEDDESAEDEETESEDDESAEDEETESEDDESAEDEETESEDDESAEDEETESEDDESAEDEETESEDDESAEDEETESEDDESAEDEETESEDGESAEDEETEDEEDFAAPLPEAEQACSDLIESVALEQTALSHILNAEGEKVQKAVSMQISWEDLMEVNDSAAQMIKAITELESILLQKVEAVQNI